MAASPDDGDAAWLVRQRAGDENVAPALAEQPLITCHDTCGLLHRLRRELTIGNEATALRWLYAETRCVVLIDVRHATLMWSRQPHEALDRVLGGLANGALVESTIDRSSTVVAITPEALMVATSRRSRPGEARTALCFARGR